MSLTLLENEELEKLAEITTDIPPSSEPALQHYKHVNQLQVKVRLFKKDDQLYVAIGANVVGSDNLVDRRRVVWNLGQLNERRGGSLRLWWNPEGNVPGARVIALSIPKPDAPTSSSKHFAKVADLLSHLLIPQHFGSLRHSAFIREFCREVQSQFVTLYVMNR